MSTFMKCLDNRYYVTLIILINNSFLQWNLFLINFVFSSISNSYTPNKFRVINYALENLFIYLILGKKRLFIYLELF